MKCKVICSTKQYFTKCNGEIKGYNIFFTPSSSIENNGLFENRDDEELSLSTTNLNVASKFEENKEYYIEITPVLK